jgi:mono/diheme cytochrome c family protein
MRRAAHGPSMLVGLVVLLAGCDDGSSSRDDVSSTRAVQTGAFPIPPGSRPRGEGALRRAASTSPDNLAALSDRGRERYAVFCTPCHGTSGAGDGRVVAHGFPRPPPIGGDRHRPEEVARIIAQGVGRMLPMAERIPPQDRWAIAAYLATLEAAP